VLDVLHAGGKFRQWRLQGGPAVCHGGGHLAVVNALSEWVEVTVRAPGQVAAQALLEQGTPDRLLALKPDSSGKTRAVRRFKPDTRDLPPVCIVFALRTATF